MLHAPLLYNPLEINSPCGWIRTPPSPPLSGVLTCYCQGLLDFLIISSLHALFLHPNRIYHLQFIRANQQTINVPTISGWVGINLSEEVAASSLRRAGVSGRTRACKFFKCIVVVGVSSVDFADRLRRCRSCRWSIGAPNGARALSFSSSLM